MAGEKSEPVQPWGRLGFRLKSSDEQTAQPKPFALLIRAEFGASFFFTELGDGGTGGFDHRANQRDHHASLLDRWLAFDSRPILGRPFEPLELVT